MKILYDTYTKKDFDLEKFYNSLNKYGKVEKEAIEQELKNWHYENLHYSCLVEIGIKLLPDEKSAREYFENHYVEGRSFERLRRITGYLVGTLARFNDAKKAEVAERVKHSVGGQYGQTEKDYIEVLKFENSIMAQV